ncbi:DUF1989 domain-containing protein [Actinoplanes sp. RD1]|uniref:DUF1989 domain-containing protein n=1 Tax=Actinoplanes sp. RD1 TaxID=3064538 RepID=UPI0027424072|nr:DUF1989 domain-containing protein [Actinoplanes sp. RD1]
MAALRINDQQREFLAFVIARDPALTSLTALVTEALTQAPHPARAAHVRTDPLTAAHDRADPPGAAHDRANPPGARLRDDPLAARLRADPPGAHIRADPAAIAHADDNPDRAEPAHGDAPHPNPLPDAHVRDEPVRGERVRAEHVLAPGTGKAVEVRAGEVLTVTQILGHQCVDLNVFTLADRHERLHVGRTRGIAGTHPGAGDVLWSNTPWERPIAVILRSTARTDTTFPFCSRLIYSAFFGMHGRTNCEQIQQEAQREYGLLPWEMHESLNLFMSTENGVIQRNTARPGDHIAFLALHDLLMIPNVCGDDLTNCSNFGLRPVRVTVMAATADDHETGRRAVARAAGLGLPSPAPFRRGGAMAQRSPCSGSPADPARSPADPGRSPANSARSPADPARSPADPARSPADPARSPGDPGRSPADPARQGASGRLDPPASLPAAARLQRDPAYVPAYPYLARLATIDVPVALDAARFAEVRDFARYGDDDASALRDIVLSHAIDRLGAFPGNA